MQNANAFEINKFPVFGNLLQAKSTKQRVWEVDFLRGLCIFLMLFDHLMYNFAFLPTMAVNFNYIGHPIFIDLFRFGQRYWDWNVRMVVRNVVVAMFLFLSGVSCSFTKSNPKRLLKLVAAAGAVTFATYFVDLFLGFDTTSLFILFGILHIMALGLAVYVIIYFATKFFTDSRAQVMRLILPLVCLGLSIFLVIGGIRLEYWDLSTTGLVFLRELLDLRFFWWAVVAAFLFMVAFVYLFIKDRFIGKRLYKKLDRRLGRRLSKNKNILWFVAYAIYVAILAVGFFLLINLLPYRSMGREQLDAMMLLITGYGRFGSDFYGFFPFVGFFLFGSFIGLMLYSKHTWAGLDLNKGLVDLTSLNGWWNKGFSFIGKNGLIIYLTHQVILFLAVVFSAMAVGIRFW